MRIHYDDRQDLRSWYLTDADGPNESRIFSFDLPQELFLLYARSGELSRRDAADLKQTHLAEMVGYYSPVDEVPRQVTFKLDPGWIAEVVARTRRA